MIEHERVEQKLQEAQDMLAGIIGSAMDAIIVMDDEQRVLLFNIAAEKMFSYSASDAIGGSIERFIPQRFRAAHSTHVHRFGEDGITNRMMGDLGTLWGLRATGEEFPIEASISALESGGKRFFTAVIRDITERHRAQEAVRESEKRFRLVADTAPVLIWMSGADKLCTYFNRPWLCFTGRSVEQELGNGWAEGVHPDDLQRCLDIYTQSFDRREDFRMEYRLRHHDAEYRWILDIGVPRFDQDGSFAGYIGSVVDITERKLAEERLRMGQWAAHIGTYEWNIRTGVSIWTPELEALYGLPPGGFGGTRAAFENLVHPDDRRGVVDLIDEAIKSGQPTQGEWRIVWPDGSLHWIAARGQVLMNEFGEPSRMFGVHLDITERKRAEEALTGMTRKLIEAQEQERSRIGRELHDDISQRLALLAIDLEQLKENSLDIESGLQQLRNRMTEIAHGIQALSHDLDSSKLEYLGLVAGMKSWCREFAARQKMEIDFKGQVHSFLPGEVGLSLFRVLQEALHNASKYSGVKRLEVQLSEDVGEIHLVVSDSGRGFDVEGALQGKGLGLTSMRERVRLVNGSITISSKLTCGTKIHVRVPLRAEKYSQLAAG